LVSLSGRVLVGKLSLAQLGRGNGAAPAHAQLFYTAQVNALTYEEVL